MIKRFYKAIWANVSDFIRLGGDWADSDLGSQGRSFSQELPKNNNGEINLNPLAGYYANLELPCGSGRDELKRSWKRLLKKYHPDLHSADPEKRKIATELTGLLNEAYHILDKELSKKG